MLKLNPSQKDLVGRTALHIAALYGYIEIVRWFVEECNMQPDARDNKGQTPLHNASSQGHLLIVKYFVGECKCNSLLTNNKRETPLHVAALNGHVDVVQYYTLQQNVHPLCPNISYKTPLYLAMYHDQQNVVMFYIQNYLHIYPAIEQLGYKLFGYSVIKGHLHILKELVQKLKWTRKQKGFHQNQFLSLATENGHVDILQYLLCTVNWEYCPLPEEQYSNTLLHKAALMGQMNVVKFFIDELNYDPTLCNSNGSTPLHEACIHGQLHVIKYLFENTKLDNSFVDGKLMTPLHYAASFNQLEAVKCLVTEFNCDPTCRDSRGNTPLHCATGNGHIKIIKFFLSNSALNPDIVNSEQLTLMHFACMYGEAKTTEYLLEKYSSLFSSIDKYGRTPVFYLVKMGCLEILKSAIKNNPNFEKTQRDKNNFTLLHCAAMFGQLNIMRYLIQDLSCDPNIPTVSGDTPLHIACYYGHINVGKYLVSIPNCKVMPLANEGVYPTHSAAENGQLEVFKWLTLDLKLDPLSRDNNGKTPFHYAATNMHYNIIQFGLETLTVDASVTDNDGNNLLHTITFRDFIQKSETADVTMAKHQNNSYNNHLQKLKIINLLLEYKYSPASTNKAFLSPLHIASNNGFVEAVKIFLIELEKQGINSAIQDTSGMIPLHYACMNGHIDVVDMIVQDSSALWIDVPLNKDLESPLHKAAGNGYLELIKLLVNKKMHIPFCVDNQNATPLHYAIAQGHLDTVKFFLSKFDIKPNFDNCFIRNLLQFAFNYNDDMVMYLLEKYKKILNPVSILLSAIFAKGSVPVIDFIVSLWKKDFKKKMSTKNAIKVLFNTISKGELKVVSTLIEKLGLDPNLKDEHGFNALHFACQFGKASIAMYLLSTQKCDVHAKTADQSTALHLASQSGLIEVIKVLLQNNCKILDCQNQGNNSIHYAAMYGHLLLVTLYTKEYKCDSNIPGGEDWTPLHFAANYGHLNVVEYLVSTFNINLNARESHKRASPLHLACCFGNLDIVKYLTGVYETRKIDYPLDKDEKTPLHYAARAGHLSIVKHLILEKHFDPMYREKDAGDTPLHLAASKGHSDVVAFLIWELDCNPKMLNYFMQGHSPWDKWQHGMSIKFEFGYKNRELHKAVEEGSTVRLTQLIEHKEHNPNQPDKLNRTPLHYAAMHGEPIMVKKLLGLGADPLAEDIFHNLPIHYAAALGHVNVVDFLVFVHKSNLVCISERRGMLEMTPLDMAFFAGRKSLENILNEVMKDIKFYFTNS